MDANKRYRVGIAYHFLPDYRAGVFKELLKSDKLEVEFLAGDNGSALSGVPEATGIPHHRLKNRWAGRVLWQSGLLTKLYREKYDVVVLRGSWLTLTTWVAAPLLRIQRTPVLFWSRGWKKRDRGVVRLIRLFYLRLANALLLYGDRAKSTGMTCGYPEKRMRVIGNSIPLPTLDISTIRKPDEARPLVLWVTRILDYKQPDLLIRAVKAVQEKGYEIDCVFIGHGEIGDLEQMRDDLGLRDRVRFLGRLDPDAVVPWCYKASVVALPNWAGLTVASSIANGVPVVVNDDAYSNPPEWDYVTTADESAENTVPVNGSYFRKNDADDLANELVRWCFTHPASSEQRRAIAAYGRELVSPERSANAIVSAIESYADTRR